MGFSDTSTDDFNSIQICISSIPFVFYGQNPALCVFKVRWHPLLRTVRLARTTSRSRRAPTRKSSRRVTQAFFSRDQPALCRWCMLAKLANRCDLEGELLLGCLRLCYPVSSCLPKALLASSWSFSRSDPLAAKCLTHSPVRQYQALTQGPLGCVGRRRGFIFHSVHYRVIKGERHNILHSLRSAKDLAQNAYFYWGVL